MLDRLARHAGSLPGYTELRHQANHSCTMTLRKGVLVQNNRAQWHPQCIDLPDCASWRWQYE